MIGIGKSISHTKASMLYGWNKEKDAKVVHRNNLIGTTPADLSKEFGYIQRMNKNCRRNTLSFVLSPVVEDKEKLTKKKMQQICSNFITKMELGDRQAIAFVHNDKNHTHIHLYVNRIDFDSKAYEDNFIGKKSQRIAADVAKELGLKTVKEHQQEKLKNLKSLRASVYDCHLKVLKQAPKDLTEYLSSLKNYGIKVIPTINGSNQLQGFRFKLQGMDLKGSEVHRNLTGSNILKSLSSISPHFLKNITRDELQIENKHITLNHTLEKAVKQIDKGNNKNNSQKR
jgi:hypothetical protein